MLHRLFFGAEQEYILFGPLLTFTQIRNTLIMNIFSDDGYKYMYF